MPTLLVEYIKSKVSKMPQQAFDDMQAALTKLPPTELSTKDSPHYSLHYKSQIEDGLLGKTIVAKCMIEIILDQISLCSPNGFCSFWNEPYPIEKNLAMPEYAILQAATLELYGIGNCAQRAAYAAFVLFSIFKDTNVEVHLKNNPKLDHYVVYVGNKKDGWMIYDPLTNPELLFPFTDYQKDILPLFKQVEKPARDLSFKITEETLNLFQRKKIRIRSYLHERLTELNYDPKKIDPRLIMALRQKGITSDIPTHIEEGYNALKSMVALNHSGIQDYVAIKY